jgi:chromosome segregation ATPase
MIGLRPHIRFRRKGCIVMHKGFFIVAAAAGLWVAAKTTNLGSYAGTLWAQVRSEGKRQISTKFEIQRARHEIAQLDKDISGMIRPIAEYKAALQQLDKDIRQGQSNLSDRREALLLLTQDLESKPAFVTVAGRQIPAAKAKTALERDFEGFQRLERHVESLRKLQEAKQNSLEAAQEQLAKLIAKKREFEVRVAQLETDEETLQIAGMGNKMAVDDNRVSAIEAALADIEQRQNVRRHEHELASGDLISDVLAPPTRAPARRSTTDLAAMKAYLENTPKE